MLIGAFSYQILMCEEFSDAINQIVTVSNYLINNVQAEAGLTSGNSVFSIKKAFWISKNAGLLFLIIFLNGGGEIKLQAI